MIKSLNGLSNFVDSSESLNYTFMDSLEGTISIFLLLIYFFFKLGLGPFYIWVVEVYNSCSSTFIILVSLIPKLIYIPLFINVIFSNFVLLGFFFKNIFFFISFFSLVISSAGILISDRLKEIYAWSSVMHTSNIFLILSCSTHLAFAYLHFYLFTYIFISLGFISIFVCLKNYQTGCFIKTTKELPYAGYLMTPFYFVIFITLASSAGFTPFISFFMKFSLLNLLNQYNYYYIFFFLVGFFNIVGSFAYLKIL